MKNSLEEEEARSGGGRLREAGREVLFPPQYLSAADPDAPAEAGETH